MLVSGVWAENDSDEEDSRRGFGGGGGKKQADYSAPMNFVSGGLKDGDKGKKREHTEPGDDDVTIISSTKTKVGIFLVDVRNSSVYTHRKITVFRVSSAN